MKVFLTGARKVDLKKKVNFNNRFKISHDHAGSWLVLINTIWDFKVSLAESFCHKLDFMIQQIAHSLCVYMWSVKHEQEGVNSGNRITQHVKNELDTTAHVWRN